MNFDFTEEQRAIRDLIRRVAADRIAPRAREIDASAEYPQDMFDLLKDLGLFTLPFPTAYGGADSMVSSCLAVEELARVCYNTAYLLVVQWTPFGAILAGGTEAQKQKYLPGLASGDLRAAFSLTEAQSGSDVAGIQTRAERCDGGYRLNGAKVWCTNAALSDFIVVAAKITGAKSAAKTTGAKSAAKTTGAKSAAKTTGAKSAAKTTGAKSAADAGRGAINFFILEPGMAGFEIGAKEDKMGARGIPSSALFFDNVFVPAENRLGPEGEGFKIVMEALNLSRPIIGARGVGLAQGAMDHAIEFVKNRHAFGRTISDFQGVQWMLADMAIQTEAARNLVYKAAAAVDAGVRGPQLAALSAVAKCHATDTAMDVAENAVQLFGAAGISNDFPINRYFRDAKVLKIVEGANQIQRNIIARGLLA